jgi:S1-C subfamily serine protease
MATIIQKHNAGEKVTLHILRSGTEKDVEVTLGERTS